jgi:uncharacterized protein (TIGR02145 family)
MKKKLLFCCLILFFTTTINAQNDTIFVMKNGVIINQIPTSNVDSIIFYRPIINPYGTFTDPRDNRIYSTILINNQLWMAENLAYLPMVSSSYTGSKTTPFYYVLGYNGTDTSAAKATSNFQTYGVLYNWPAALTACPPGWHLPSDAEFIAFSTFLGGDNIAGGKLKEAGFDHWSSPNTGATNEIGFTALPGNSRNITGGFQTLGYYCYFWSTLEYNIEASYGRGLFYNYNVFQRNHHYKDYGLSVRCIMD